MELKELTIINDIEMKQLLTTWESSITATHNFLVGNVICECH